MRTAAVVSFMGFMSVEVALGAPQEQRSRRRARPAAAPAPAAAPTPSTGGFRGPTRIDFDDRLIQGQTNKSGAVYLFDRKETGISSMVRRRKSFRHLTIETIYDR
ncbi:MAG: hypothetical protein AAFN74_22060 [Myxococcota bacterium]